jgi:hypothetical protein
LNPEGDCVPIGFGVAVGAADGGGVAGMASGDALGCGADAVVGEQPSAA